MQVSRLLDVFGGPTGISKGLKKRKIPEGSGVSSFWNSEGMGGWAFWNCRGQQGVKILIPPWQGMDIFWNHPIPGHSFKSHWIWMIHFVSICFILRSTVYTAYFFSVKWVRFFVCTEPEFPKIYQWLPKTSDDFGRSPDNFRRLPKISRPLPKITEGVERFSKGIPTWVPKMFWPLLERQKNWILIKLNWFLSNHTHYCWLGVRNWSECVRWQFWIRRRETHA